MLSPHAIRYKERLLQNVLLRLITASGSNSWDVKKYLYLKLVDLLVGTKGSEQTKAKTF